MASPMPSRRHLAAAPSPPPLHLHGDLLGLGEGGFPALHGEHGPERASGPFGVRVAGPADDVAQKCAMHRWYPARGSMERTVETRPAQRSPTTRPTPLRSRSIMPLTNCSQLAESSFMPSATPMTSRWPSESTPTATGTLTFSTEPPHERLCHTPSMNT